MKISCRHVLEKLRKNYRENASHSFIVIGKNIIGEFIDSPNSRSESEFQLLFHNSN